jgi:tetratricopeptide (TPR) repeat protein
MTFPRALLIICVVAVSAHADKGRPWERGSTLAQRERAHKTFSEGNDHFFRREYAKALELYEQALVEFDHPRIRLAAAETLVLLGRPDAAQADLDAALQYGAEPFDPDEYARAKELQKTLARQLGSVVVKCTTEGAQLTLDGKDLMMCPGEATRVVMPGRHQIVGKKDGFIPLTEQVLVEPARQAKTTVELKPLEVAAGFTRQRRWRAWKPWAVVAGGAGLALLGAAVQWRASAKMDDFRDAVSACGLAGCPAGDPAFDLESRATLYNRIAISMWVTGGATVVAGLVGVYMNREKLVPMESGPNVTLAPTSGGLLLTLSGDL